MNTLKTTANLRLFALGIVMLSFLMSSCTSLQQTTTIATDDLYYAPNKQVAETQAVAANEEDGYQDYQNYQDDRYLRMKVANRNRWSGIDDWGYWNDPRFNYSYYPSYMGWNSWYTGYYGSSWYSPFGPSYSMGWGGYSPYSSFGYGLGWGGYYDNFAFGYGGFGYGGFGYGLGYGYGWNPYYMGNWNPYGYNYGMGGIYGGGVNVRNYDKRVPMQNRTGLDPYINNANRLKGRGDIPNNNAAFVGSNSNNRTFSNYLPNTNMSVRSMNSNSYNSYGSNGNNSNGFSARNSNSNAVPSANSNRGSNGSSNSFGSLVMRAITSNSNSRSSNSNSYNSNSDNSSRYNSNSNSNNSSNRSAPAAPSVSAPVSSGSSSSGSSTGGGFIGGGRKGGGGQ